LFIREINIALAAIQGSASSAVGSAVNGNGSSTRATMFMFDVSVAIVVVVAGAAYCKSFLCSPCCNTSFVPLPSSCHLLYRAQWTKLLIQIPMKLKYFIEITTV